MRLFLIPGFGEEPWIFEKIWPLIPGDKVVVDNWKLLGTFPRPDDTSLEYARELIYRYRITPQDVVIGHSMGGWIGLHIKHLIGCPLVHLASWTDPQKVVRTQTKPGLAHWVVGRGLVFNQLTLLYLMRKKYGKTRSGLIYKAIFKRLMQGPLQTVVSQLRIINAPVPEEMHVQPDLRIHARADATVYFPDESTHEVPGDHLSLFTYPESVAVPINEFLQTLNRQRSGVASAKEVQIE